MKFSRYIADKVFIWLSFVCVIAAMVPLASILYYVTVNGISAINWDFFTQLPPPPGFQVSGGGLGNAIQGTLILVGLAAAIGIPIGVFSGVYISEYGNNFYGRTVRLLGDVLVGNPSIVVGVLLYVLIVIPEHGFSVKAGSVALAVMMIPIISATTSEALKLVPNSIREASVALGVKRWRTVLLVVNNAKTGIATGVLLATARVMGETAPLIYTVAVNNFWYSGLSAPVGYLTYYIWNYATSGFQNWTSLAWGAAFILIVMILVINIAVRTLTRGRQVRV